MKGVYTLILSSALAVPRRQRSGHKWRRSKTQTRRECRRRGAHQRRQRPKGQDVGGRLPEVWTSVPEHHCTLAGSLLAACILRSAMAVLIHTVYTVSFHLLELRL